MKAIFRHTIRFYAVLDAKAVEEDGLRLFRGHPTTVVTEEMELPGPYYTQMRATLITIGCIKQIKRGSAKSYSEWVLVRPPTDEDFENVDPNPTSRIDNNTFRLYQIATDAAIENIEERLGGMNIARALVDLQREINALRTQVESLKENATNAV